jgi:hypothetical protein
MKTKVLFLDGENVFSKAQGDLEMLPLCQVPSNNGDL